MSPVSLAPHAGRSPNHDTRQSVRNNPRSSQRACRFLNDCDKATRERVARGGGTLADEPLRAADLLTGPQRGVLESGGMDDKKLGPLFVAMEEFWNTGAARSDPSKKFILRQMVVPLRDPEPSTRWDTTWPSAPLSDCFMNHFGPRTRVATRNVSQPARLVQLRCSCRDY